MKTIGLAIPILLGLCIACLTMAQEQSPSQPRKFVNTDSQGLGAHGYDPVAFFTDGKALKGDQQYQSSYGGAIYYFASTADKEAFDKEPDKYAPQYGGYCAMAMTMGKLEDVDPNYFVVDDGKLLLQRNEKAHIMFAKDVKGNHKKADQNWTKLQQGTPN